MRHCLILFRRRLGGLRSSWPNPDRLRLPEKPLSWLWVHQSATAAQRLGETSEGKRASALETIGRRLASLNSRRAALVGAKRGSFAVLGAGARDGLHTRRVCRGAPLALHTARVLPAFFQRQLNNPARPVPHLPARFPVRLRHCLRIGRPSPLAMALPDSLPLESPPLCAMAALSSAPTEIAHPMAHVATQPQPQCSTAAWLGPDEPCAPSPPRVHAPCPTEPVQPHGCR
ncbi:hypothetical protein BS50DRAFT_139450 [Corynespora cassiicola Philippines]|uniref:Uncharacterized protein n=1 Tax=Corynespora cassiicola Philippines TaxID=1448308 RepID=A0A2T2N9V9_CORCC|nr:hypothetical protein BS50DRAFT_139450 [Corynespora cassiicola Philippines]